MGQSHVRFYRKQIAVFHSAIYRLNSWTSQVAKTSCKSKSIMKMIHSIAHQSIDEIVYTNKKRFPKVGPVSTNIKFQIFKWNFEFSFRLNLTKPCFYPVLNYIWSFPEIWSVCFWVCNQCIPFNVKAMKIIWTKFGVRKMRIWSTGTTFYRLNKWKFLIWAYDSMLASYCFPK